MAVECKEEEGCKNISQGSAWKIHLKLILFTEVGNIEGNRLRPREGDGMFGHVYIGSNGSLFLIFWLLKSCFSLCK